MKLIKFFSYFLVLRLLYLLFFFVVVVVRTYLTNQNLHVVDELIRVRTYYVCV